MKTNLNPPAPVIRRLLTTLACILAFMVMASVFSPDRTRAGGLNDPLPGIPPRSIDIAPSDNSVDPHEGLRSLGVIEDRTYSVHIYATQDGPRYSVYERASGRECGALLTLNQLHRAFPDLQLPTMDFGAQSPLMMADTLSDTPGSD